MNINNFPPSMYGGISTYQQEDPIHILYESALSFYKEGVFLEAMTRLYQLLKMYPNHLGAICKLAHIQYSMKNFTEAERLYNKALGIDPQNEDALKGLADVMKCNNDKVLEAGQTRTMGATSAERVQEHAKPLEPVAYHVISIGSAPLSDPIRSEADQVSNILDKLRIDLGSMWRDLLDVECQLFSAKENLPSTQPLVTKLKDKQIELLKSLDLKIKPMEFDFLASVPISNQVRCMTWLEGSSTLAPLGGKSILAPLGGKSILAPLEGSSTLAPFATYIVENKMHVMMYNVRPAFSLEKIIIKLVLDDCLIDIPLDNSPKYVSSTLIIVILPIIEVDDNETDIVGVKTMLFLDHSLKERT
jgi:tetratricopeptide repeat protein